MPSMNVPLFRGDEELELEVEFGIDSADPSVGIMSWGADIQKIQVYSKSERAWTGIELDAKEDEKVLDYIHENYEPDFGEDDEY